jgi:hypothetical protein
VTDIPDELWNFFPPWLAVGLAVLSVLVYVVGHKGAQETVSKAVALVTGFRSKRDREAKRRNADVDYQIEDLWRQVRFLEEQLAELRLRDEMYWAWILTDQEWHRHYEFTAAEQGWATIPHVSFMEFRDDWLAQRSRRAKNQAAKGELPF